MGRTGGVGAQVTAQARVAAIGHRGVAILTGHAQLLLQAGGQPVGRPCQALLLL